MPHRPSLRLDVQSLRNTFDVWSGLLSRGGEWSSAFVYGANVPKGGRAVHTALVESSIDIDGGNTVFGRAEYVGRTAAELTLIGSIRPEQSVWAVSVGYARRVAVISALESSVGGRATVHAVPVELRPFYGSRTPVGLFTYFRASPTPMRLHPAH